MTTYIVYSIDEDKVLFATDSYDRARSFAEERLSKGWSLRGGKHYCPVVIWDVWVHDKDCTCATHCGGIVDD